MLRRPMLVPCSLTNRVPAAPEIKPCFIMNDANGPVELPVCGIFRDSIFRRKHPGVRSLRGRRKHKSAHRLLVPALKRAQPQ